MSLDKQPSIMKARAKLFSFKRPYDLEATNALFVKAMKENVDHQYRHCEAYKGILDKQGFHPRDLKTMEDLARLPFIPTLYYKHHEIYSMPKKKMIINATSSGTSSGTTSHIGFNIESLLRGWSMLRRIFSYHRIWSLKPTRFIIFGYQPSKKNKRAIAKTAHGFTFTAPAKSKDYALKVVNGEYQLDLAALKANFIRYAKGRNPVRTLGFPAYTYFLLKEMEEEGIRLKLPKGSLITIGGGWKEFYKEQVDKQEFYQLVYDVLGVDEKHIVEFFGAVEHPILYTDCRYHHFHIPVYSRVIIRDVDTLKPLKPGQMGMINLLTPMVMSTPILSVMTDDLGILHHTPCPCGEKSPYLEIIGRVGVADIKTCAAGAEEILKEQGS